MNLKRKLLSVLSIVLMLTMVLLATGCVGSNVSTESAPGESETVSDTASNTKPPTGETVTLTAIVAGLTEDSPSGEALKNFANLCKEYSDDSVNIDVFFNTELGSVGSCVESCAQGTLDIVSTGTSYFSGYAPEIQVFELPFLFDTYEQVRTTLDSEPGDMIAEKFNGSGMKLLCYWESGMRHVSSGKRQINEMNDMAGQKIRTVVSATQQATWEAFGALPMALDMGEVFTALQNGTVDAQENTLSSIVTYKMYEVQKYLSMTYHAYTPMPFFINEKVWNDLSEAQQEAVQRAAEESRDLARQLNSDSETDNLKLLADKGVEIQESPDRESFKAVVQPVYDMFNEQIGTEEVLKQVQDFVKTLN